VNIELTDQERGTIVNALKTYLSNLREEISKTEKHEWKAGLHDEENILNRVIEKLK